MDNLVIPFTMTYKTIALNKLLELEEESALFVNNWLTPYKIKLEGNHITF